MPWALNGPLSLALTLLSGPEGPSSREVRVRADVGSRIFVNGTFRGLVDPRGILSFTATRGVLEVVADRRGFLPEHRLVSITTQTSTVVDVVGAQPTRPSSRTHDSTLLVATAPQNVSVTSSRFGWQKLEKTGPLWVGRHLPAGRYRLTLCTEYQCLDYRGQLRRGRLQKLFVDFESAEVRDQSADAERAERSASRACTRSGTAETPEACLEACRFDRFRSLERHSVACSAALGRPRALDAGGVKRDPLRLIEVSSDRPPPEP
ncbi:MAG: hypothetical protein IPK13_23170 [Deltaproteobacteria bacterium]|nr:hypothetical protein [Deltaproteobacteria bacterium]